MQNENPVLRKCPVCGNEEFKEEFTCIDHLVSGESYPIFRCTSCEFRFTGSAPGSEESCRYYKSEAYVSHSDTSKGAVNKAYHFARHLMLKQKARIVRNSTGMKKGSVLDIGAGTGYFMELLRKKGWKVSGTEKNEAARNFALEQWQLSLLPEDALFSIPDGSFDVITLWHVMEHLHDLMKYWEKFPELLKPEGCLIVALPNHGSFDAEHYKECWAAWDVPRHLWHFSPANAEQIAAKAGFSLTKIYRMPFDALYISILSEQYRKSAFPLLKGLFYGKVSWMISLFRPLKCSSLIYVFRHHK